MRFARSVTWCSPQGPVNSRTTTKLAIILVSALLLRGFMLVNVNHYLWYGGMSTHFGIGAEYLAQGRGYAISRDLSRTLTQIQQREERLIDPEAFRSELPGDEYLTLERPPAYSGLLAATFLATDNHRYLWLQLIQIFTDSLVCILLFRLIRTWSTGAGLTAAALYAAWPPMARNAVLVMPEAFLPFLLACTTMVILRAITSADLRTVAAAGVLNGCTAYFRTEVVLLGVFLLPAFYFAWKDVRRALGAALIFIAVTAAVLTPWVLRNRRITGEPLLTSSMWSAIWVGVGEYRNPYGMVPDNASVVKELEDRGVHDLVEQDRIFKERFLNAVTDSPALFVVNALRRFVRYLFLRTDWGFVELFTRSVTYDEIRSRGGGPVQYFFAAPHLVVLKAAPWLFDCVMVVCALAGAIVGWRRRWVPSVVLVALPLYFIATRAWIAYDPRHAVPGLWPYPGLVAILIDASRARRSGPRSERA